MKKRIWALLGLITLLCLSACEPQADGYTIQGEPVVFKDHQVLVLTYWAKWCHLCKGNIPVLNTLQKELGDQVLVMGLDFDGSTPELQQQVAQEFHMDYLLLQGDLKDIHLPPPENIPLTYIFTPKHHHVYSTLMGSLDAYTLKEVVHNAREESD